MIGWEGRRTEEHSDDMKFNCPYQSPWQHHYYIGDVLTWIGRSDSSQTQDIKTILEIRAQEGLFWRRHGCLLVV